MAGWLGGRLARVGAVLFALGGAVVGVAVVGGPMLLTAEAASAQATTTFTSGQVGTSGQTAQFTETGLWQMAWSYDCSNYGSNGNFSITVNQPANDLASDVGPNELGMSGSGTDHYTDTGTFSLSILSECNWTITVSQDTAAPATGSATFTSGQVGTSGQTAQFTETGLWQMAWSYDCSNYGTNGNFSITVNQPANDLASDVGPNELGMSGSGTDHYTDTGTFSLSILSECNWTITVSQDTAAPATGTTTTTTGGGAGTGSGIALTRLAGNNRDLTAIAASQNEFPATDSARAVVLATDANFPDALAGTPFAVAKDAPILLTPPTTLDTATGTEIQRVLAPGGTVYILGGSAAVSQGVAAQVQVLGYVVVREAGPTRFATALVIASGLGNPSAVFEADGTTFQDALVAGPAAAKAHGVVLLTNGTAMPADTGAYLGAHPGPHYVVGSAAQVADPGGAAVGGSDPYATSVAVAAKFFGTTNLVGFASGVTYPDELSGGANIGAASGPMILVPATGALPSSVSGYLVGSSITSGLLYGGTGAVGSGVMGEIAGS